MNAEDALSTDELLSRLSELGISVPRGTIYRWSWHKLIPSIKTYGVKKTQGRFGSWPVETIEQVAAVYRIRRCKIVSAKRTTKAILAAKDVVGRFYAIIDEFNETEDPRILRKFNDLQKPVTSPLFVPRGKRGGYMRGGLELASLVNTWIATVEKVRNRRPVFDPINVIFSWRHRVISEDGAEKIRMKYDGVTFKPSDADTKDTITQVVGHTPDALEKRLGRKPTSSGIAKREFRTIIFNQKTDWNNWEFDAKNQQIIIKDPQTGKTSVWQARPKEDS